MAKVVGRRIHLNPEGMGAYIAAAGPYLPNTAASSAAICKPMCVKATPATSR